MFVSLFFANRAANRLRSLSKNPKLAAVARKQRYAGLRGKYCDTPRVRDSAPITPAGGSASCTSTFLTLWASNRLRAFGPDE